GKSGNEIAYDGNWSVLVGAMGEVERRHEITACDRNDSEQAPEASAARLGGVAGAYRSFERQRGHRLYRTLVEGTFSIGGAGRPLLSLLACAFPTCRREKIRRSIGGRNAACRRHLAAPALGPVITAGDATRGQANDDNSALPFSFRRAQ